MFTGIVQGVAPLHSLEKKPQLHTLGLAIPAAQRDQLTQGASIALNGVCLTVTHWDEDAVYFDVMIASLQLTNLGQLAVGDLVNFERAARFGDEIGGHAMSGHVMGCVTLCQRHELDADNLRLDFSLPPQWKKYIFNKGYIGLNGCSLTIAEVHEERFSVYLIPETRRATTFGLLPEGSQVNLEVDPHTQVIVDSVERVLAQRQLEGV
ncbi:riboflavin synthase subunit alpha [Marinospirillum sp. MEB164]|uniref:Riboflavin synthase n=1 Tax=Marinospirillum alkalitolerans TaxID=3123374 RepID=A0ABW8PX47_9GAMM